MPDKLITVVVGNADEIQPALDTLGVEVTPLDVTIPDPPDVIAG